MESVKRKSNLTFLLRRGERQRRKKREKPKIWYFNARRGEWKHESRAASARLTSGGFLFPICEKKTRTRQWCQMFWQETEEKGERRATSDLLYCIWCVKLIPFQVSRWAISTPNQLLSFVRLQLKSEDFHSSSTHMKRVECLLVDMTLSSSFVDSFFSL